MFFIVHLHNKWTQNCLNAETQCRMKRKESVFCAYCFHRDFSGGLFVMVKTIADLLLFDSLTDAELLNHEADRTLWIRDITGDLSLKKSGLIYVLPCNAAFGCIKDYPDAAGFIVETAIPAETEIPVILCSNPEAVIAEWNRKLSGYDPVADLYEHVMKGSGRTEESVLNDLADYSGTCLILKKEDDVIISGSCFDAFPDLNLETLLSSGSGAGNRRNISVTKTRVSTGAEKGDLFSVREGWRSDSFAAECLALAFRAARSSDSLGAAETHQLLAELVIQDFLRMARSYARINRIMLPPQSEVILLFSQNRANLAPWMSSIREFCSSYGRICLMEPVGKDVLILQEPLSGHKERLRQLESLGEYCAANRIPAVVVGGIRLCDQVCSPGKVLRLIHASIKDAHLIYPKKKFFLASELRLVRDCRRAIQERNEEFEQCVSVLNSLSENRGERELAETLAVYLIDENMSITETSGRLFVHRNTIKYRIQKAEDLMGMSISNVTDLREIILMLGISRLLMAKQ